MLPIDRFALHSLQDLVAKAHKAYEGYDFHVIYHALFNYCTLDLSAFYLDILKDRLYTSPPQSRERRSAQTALYLIAGTLARLMAPIMAFTAEEIWRYLPGAADKAESVHMAELPQADESLRDESLAAQWRTIKQVRAEVTKALEAARAAKTIGHSLDAAVTVGLEGDLYAVLEPYREELRSIFIVSRAELVNGILQDGYRSEEMPGVSVRVAAAEGEKCSRCWIHETTVGHQPGHPQLCGRCYGTLKTMGQV
ncbi:MAG: class I tRNA ligase family protein [Desulfosarcinaceae bacterium]